jgi:toxin ParE1/3/4
MPGFELAPAAESDLLDIYVFGAGTFGERAADRYHSDLERAFARLGGRPQLGRPREELAQGLRSLLCREHVIFYRVHAERVEIIRVLHQRQDASAALRSP